MRRTHSSAAARPSPTFNHIPKVQSEQVHSKMWCFPFDDSVSRGSEGAEEDRHVNSLSAGVLFHSPTYPMRPASSSLQLHCRCSSPSTLSSLVYHHFLSLSFNGNLCQRTRSPESRLQLNTQGISHSTCPFCLSNLVRVHCQYTTPTHPHPRQ
jgi:hypothetical protein